MRPQALTAGSALLAGLLCIAGPFPAHAAAPLPGGEDRAEDSLGYHLLAMRRPQPRATAGERERADWRIRAVGIGGLDTTRRADLGPGPASGPGSGPLQLRLGVDLQLTLTGLTLALLPELMPSPWSEAPAGSALDRRSINPLDRSVVGNRSRRWAKTSDALLAINSALPYLALLGDELISGSGGGLASAARDGLILLETFAVSSLVCNLVKFGVQRPRPYFYDPRTPPGRLTETTARLSFFSGHTSLSFTMATAYSYLFGLRHPGSPAVLPIWIGTHLLAGLTGVGRVMAGKHFWTDVLAGAAAGSAVGLLFPMLHRVRRDGSSLLGSSRLAEIRVTPTFPDDGFGVSALLIW